VSWSYLMAGARSVCLVSLAGRFSSVLCYRVSILSVSVHWVGFFLACTTQSHEECVVHG
jgi:hypothetical protein